jgi:hypothetical protein
MGRRNAISPPAQSSVRYAPLTEVPTRKNIAFYCKTGYKLYFNNNLLDMNTQNAILISLITLFLASSCHETPSNGPTNAVLLEKENELLRRENELLKREQELAPQSSKGHVSINSEPAQAKVQSDQSLNALKKLEGKYPYEVHLLENPKLKNRLKALLGSRFIFLKETWAVETPIEVRSNIFIASGCQQHNCGNTNFIIVIDFAKDVLYAGIREDQIVKVYSEDGSSNREITQWVNED